MALTVEDGTVVANANAYISLSYANTYFADDVNYDDTWAAKDDTAKEQLVKWATRILDQKVRPRFHAWESDWLTRVEACKSCDASAACMGVPRHYLALHGDAEFTPIRLRRPGAAEALP